MKANKNRFIEEWGTARENLEHNFRWSRRNIALVGLFGIALPIFVNKGIVKEFDWHYIEGHGSKLWAVASVGFIGSILQLLQLQETSDL